MMVMSMAGGESEMNQWNQSNHWNQLMIMGQIVRGLIEKKDIGLTNIDGGRLFISEQSEYDSIHEIVDERVYEEEYHICELGKQNTFSNLNGREVREEFTELNEIERDSDCE
eukprot:194635_1